jgi:hypothetical protein
MRRKHLYGLAFLAVFAAAVTGFVLARRLIGPIEAPRVDAVAQLQTVLEEVDVFALLPRRSPVPARTLVPTPAQGTAAAPRVTVGPVIVEPAVAPTRVITDAAALPSVLPDQAAQDGTPTEPARADATAIATPTPAPPTPTPLPVDTADQFVAAGPVRHGSADCPGASIRGVVRDLSGAPLRGVRLWRYDQWGNEQVVESKTADADAGQYDFPLGDTPNVHYVQVIDAGGIVISPVIEIQHRQGDTPDAACHWLDWVSR